MKNPENIETIDASRHAKLRVKPNPDFGHAKESHLVAVMLNELSPCTSNYPLVFISNKENGRTRLVAMLGLRAGENVYYNGQDWEGTYVPFLLQQHPFILGFDDRVEDNDRILATCIDRSSPLVSEEDGIAMFKDNGEETDFMKSRNQLLGTIFEGEKLTEQFTRKMVEFDLLEPFEVALQQPDGALRKITGLQTISERKLRALDAERLAELQKADFLPACYLILGSLFQLHRVVRLRNQKGNDPLVGLRVELQPEGAAAVAQ
jgi:hypothetical protein